MASVQTPSAPLNEDERDVIAAVVDAAPPLTDNIVAKLTAIFRGVA